MTRAISLLTVVLFLGVNVILSSGLGVNSYSMVQSSKTDNACGKPLFLTPYIESGRLYEGRKAARVRPPIKYIESYSGFLTINKTTNSTFFFWFFPAKNDPQNAPVALWLQGGPGAPSVWAVFNENGPYYIEDSLAIKKRKYYWAQEMSIVYIDNPVGTGFSFTNEDGYVSNEVEVGRDLYAALIQFFQLFPSYQKNDFFVTGESYAGKYVPAVAYTIHINNPSALLRINLKGLSIGDGLVDPVNMMEYGEYLYEHGLIDETVRKQFHEMEGQAIADIKTKNYTEAFRVFDKLLNGDLTPYKSLFFNATGLTSYFNYVTSNTPTKGGTIENWIKNCQNRKRIHVGTQIYDESSTVEKHLIADVMQSVAPWLEVLMDNYRVLLYNGQLDIIVAYPLTMNYVHKLRWKGKKDYLAAERKLWHVNNQLAGYVKTTGNFTEILVRDAGHMVPADQPLWALSMISKFTKNEPF